MFRWSSGSRFDCDGKTVTKLYPPNDKLIKDGQQMLPPPDFVYRRLNLPDGVPSEYDWTGISEEQPTRGGCGLQRMTVEPVEARFWTHTRITREICCLSPATARPKMS